MLRFIDTITSIPSRLRVGLAQATPRRMWAVLVYVSALCLVLVSGTAFIVYGIVVTSEKEASVVVRQTTFDTGLLKKSVEQLTAESKALDEVLRGGGSDR